MSARSLLALASFALAATAPALALADAAPPEGCELAEEGDPCSTETVDSGFCYPSSNGLECQGPDGTEPATTSSTTATAGGSGGSDGAGGADDGGAGGGDDGGTGGSASGGETDEGCAVRAPGGRTSTRVGAGLLFVAAAAATAVRRRRRSSST